MMICRFNSLVQGKGFDYLDDVVQSSPRAIDQSPWDASHPAGEARQVAKNKIKYVVNQSQPVHGKWRTVAWQRCKRTARTSVVLPGISFLFFLCSAH
ncbi:hypothetical protein I7I48_09243 [Histoplasma ohiense]|nr:hypothetical protein I7I48_09243 [Histoplasma ohiense (nom. inval.)]